ncbi:MAG: HlyD family type I secretion periplasmic adaptor subunit [Hyphomicrobium sp.]
MIITPVSNLKQEPVGGAAIALPATAPSKADDALVSVRRYMLGGLFTSIVLLGGITAWAATAQLAGAVLAHGVVVVATNVKKVQHPTGGVVGAILVRNGDRVKAGDLLVRLDETVTRASLQLVTRQIDELTGRRARLMAERDGDDVVAFPPELSARASEPAVDQILAGERTLFESRLKTRIAQKEQLSERIAGLKEEVSGTTQQAAAKSREIDLIGKELAGLETLEVKRLVPTSKMMALRREGARLDGERAQLQASAGQSRGRIAEIELQRLTIDSEAKSEAVSELRETEGKLAELFERRTAAEDQLRRVEIRSPVNGLVHQLSLFTVGGVITNTEPLMLIVPEADELVVEARIAPSDIDQARSHEKALIRFPAFNQRTTPSIEGRVKTVAADLTHEPQTGVSYYVARIELTPDQVNRLGGLKLGPGMPAEIQIKTESRTALTYLVKPIEDQISKAFKER